MRSTSDRLLDASILILLAIVGFVTAFPFYYVFVVSFTEPAEFIQAVRMGMLEEALELVDKFYKTMVSKANHEQEVREGMLQFLGGIQHTILASGYNPYSLVPGKTAYELLSEQDSTKFPVMIKDLYR